MPDRKKVVKALKDYVYFLVDKEEPKDASEAQVYEAKRKSLHNKVGEALGFTDVNSEYGRWSGFDTYTASHARDWKKARFDDIDAFIEWDADRLLDQVREKSTKESIKTCYAFKHRIRLSLDSFKRAVDSRISEAEKVINECIANWHAWLEGEVDTGKAKFVSVDKINSHDFNKYRYSIKVRLETMEQLADMPKEAYLSTVVKRYYDDNWDAIVDCLMKLESIAFRAERLYKTMPFYGYKDKHKESADV